MRSLHFARPFDFNCCFKTSLHLLNAAYFLPLVLSLSHHRIELHLNLQQNNFCRELQIFFFESFIFIYKWWTMNVVGFVIGSGRCVWFLLLNIRIIFVFCFHAVQIYLRKQFSYRVEWTVLDIIIFIMIKALDYSSLIGCLPSRMCVYALSFALLGFGLIENECLFI